MKPTRPSWNERVPRMQYKFFRLRPIMQKLREATNYSSYLNKIAFKYWDKDLTRKSLWIYLWLVSFSFSLFWEDTVFYAQLDLDLESWIFTFFKYGEDDFASVSLVWWHHVLSSSLGSCWVRNWLGIRWSVKFMLACPNSVFGESWILPPFAWYIFHTVFWLILWWCYRFKIMHIYGNTLLIQAAELYGCQGWAIHLKERF